VRSIDRDSTVYMSVYTHAHMLVCIYSVYSLPLLVPQHLQYEIDLQILFDRQNAIQLELLTQLHL
jgi:hypothetical protein